MLTKTIMRRFHSKVAIIGAGPAGNSVSAQLINTGLYSPSDITIFDPQHMHHYQPGYTNIAGGVWKTTNRNVMRDRQSLLPPGVNWVKQAVAELEPDQNTVRTAEGGAYTYDYLVVASGLQLRYDMIDGAREALDDPNCPVGSMYSLNYC
jgi:NADPH-dependent 2,4-dienoyl-CoA reductase/sulfur reductase-like enzyme